MPSPPRTTTRHIEPLVAFAKGAFWLGEQIEAARRGEPEARAWMRETVPRRVYAAWLEASGANRVDAIVAISMAYAYLADRGADLVTDWFLDPRSAV